MENSSTSKKVGVALAVVLCIIAIYALFQKIFGEDK